MNRAEQTPLLFRGVMRHLARRGLASIAEFTLPGGRRADVFALTSSGEIWIVEIKSSVEDFRTDHKWQEYRAFCDRFYFATHPGVPTEIFPEDAGLFVADAYDGELVRDCAPRALAAATRKALIIQMASLAASRLLAGQDPGALQFG